LNADHTENGVLIPCLFTVLTVSRLHMTGLQQNRLEAASGQAGVKPLRERSGLNPIRSVVSPTLRTKATIASGWLSTFATATILPPRVDNADAREFQRHINSDIMFHGLSSDPHAWDRPKPEPRFTMTRGTSRRPSLGPGPLRHLNHAK
jgi:hypothetical protein